jgi:DNA-binding response OmpR family regulator
MDRPILVVDDEHDVLKFLTRLLTDNGYRVNTATDGVEAMATIERETPALILLDLQMPHESGTGLYR